ncbi:pyruvate kinase-like protein [Dichotomopilus funicola]|uniref:Pyruvate kinase-like protein n=1 Tax=Dichotomopilus funicola TaxID=1934379 RepID=A0AAN6V6A0_9PEZI|nr:pyruvate kinase-like protein [Dichotomopilus funicola]
MPHQVEPQGLRTADGVDLYAPFTSDTILQVRTGKLKPMRGLVVQTAIDKGLCDGPVQVTELGLEDDQHDLTFHGGVDKAIHGYCSAHYSSWSAEFPSATSAFRPGGFGENLVVRHMNERNLCIGDIVSVSPPGSESDDTSVLLQISLPRQPCFKLNHRFELKNFAPNTWRTSRTGWYFRVLRTGTIRAGDTIQLISRPHPTWTLERVQEYLHRNTGDAAMNEELAGIAEFGVEAKETFAQRVVKQKAKERREREGKGKRGRDWKVYRVAERTRQTPRIASFVLEAVKAGKEGGDEDLISLRPGAHAKIKLGNGLVRTYSIVDGDRNRFQLAISLDDNSRGGSRYLHEKVQVGQTILVGHITVSIPYFAAASHHIFIAAGVGITAFLAIFETYQIVNFSSVLHYAVRSADEVPFRERLAKLGNDAVTIYDRSAGQRLDIGKIIREMPWNSQLYFCGPTRLMDEAMRETKAHGIGANEVHFEAFAADASGDPFEAVVIHKSKDSSKKTVKVGEEETLLEILQKEFGQEAVDSSCEVGNCGTCRIKLCEGRVDHRGTALMDEEKDGEMLACVSRGVGRITVEI